MKQDELDHLALDRAGKAQAILRSPLLIEARDLIKQSILNRWEKSPVRDEEGREYLFLQLKALNDVWSLLEQAVQDGKIAEHSIKLKAEEKRRFRVFKGSA